MKNIFQTSEALIQKYALPKNQVSRAAYACFDSFNTTKKDLKIGERELCLEFQKVVDEFKIGTSEILNFLDNLDYELFFIKNSCLLSLQNYNLDEQFSILRMIELSGCVGKLKILTSYFDLKNGFDYEIEIPNSFGAELYKRVDIHSNSFEFGYDGTNTAEMYSFVTTICEELEENNEYGLIEVSQFLLEFEGNANTQVQLFEKVCYFLEKFGISKEMLKGLSNGSVDHFVMEIYVDNNLDDFYDVADFFWQKDLLEILVYLEELDIRFESIKVVVEEVVEDE